MKISIVVPTLNCDSELVDLLLSLQKYDIDKETEIIIVDAGSDDNTREVANSSGSVDKFILSHGISKGEGRNVGVMEATGDIIVNLDSDVEITKGWFDALKISIENHDIVAGFSPHPKRGHIPRKPIWINGQDITWPFCNIAHRKKVFYDVGTIKDTELSEDIDFNYRCVKKGYHIAYNPKMKVYHNHTRTKKEFIKQSFLYGRCRYQINKRYPDLKKKEQSTLKNIFRYGFAGLGYVREMMWSSEEVNDE